MTVSLPPELEQWVQSKVENGPYTSSTEVIQEALRLLHEHESERARKLDTLRLEIQVGVDQIAAGHTRDFDDAVLGEIMEQGRQHIRG